MNTDKHAAFPATDLDPAPEEPVDYRPPTRAEWRNNLELLAGWAEDEALCCPTCGPLRGEDGCPECEVVLHLALAFRSFAATLRPEPDAVVRARP